jgi:hypothetical protein
MNANEAARLPKAYNDEYRYIEKRLREEGHKLEIRDKWNYRVWDQKRKEHHARATESR